MGSIASTIPGARRIKKAFEINCKTSAFHGFKVSSNWQRSTLEELLDPESTMTSSLLRDMQYGNAVELSIIEDMIKKNKEAGLSNELLEAGYSMLRIYEEDRKRIMSAI